MSFICFTACAMSFVAGAAVVASIYSSALRKEAKFNHKNMPLEKAKRREQLYDNWMMAKKYGTPMGDYLLKMGWRRVAIYGTQQLGIRLYHELKDTPIEVICSFDRNPKHIIYGIPNYKTPDLNETPPVDGVIVANFVLYDEIEEILKKGGYTDVIALDELIFEMLENRSREYENM